MESKKKKASVEEDEDDDEVLIYEVYGYECEENFE